MKKLSVLLSAAFLMIAVSAFAGSGEKCSYSTQACLNHWSGNKDAGWTGLELDKSQEGVVKVKAVTAESPAAAAGFQVGDVIMSLNGASMTDKAAMKKAKGSWKAGQAVTYKLKRGETDQEIAVTLAKAPEHVYSAMVGSHLLESHAVIATASATESETKAASASDKK